MKKFLENILIEKIGGEHQKQYYDLDYEEDINLDSLSDAWLENNTSYIYQVSVMTAIDSNKCDFVHIVIGVKHNKASDPELVGYFYFSEGENHDIRRVIDRSLSLLEAIHPVFDQKQFD